MTAVHSTVSIVKLIPAITVLHDDTLRDAVARSWMKVIDLSPYNSLDEVPQSPLFVGRSLLRHVNEVNDRAIYFYKVAVEEFGLTADHDVAIATAILHDLDKPLLFRVNDGAFALAEGAKAADHGTIGARIAREHGVPESITELVRVHSPFANVGLPGTAEGTIVHYADFVSNDFASISAGVEPVHSANKWVPKTPA